MHRALTCPHPRPALRPWSVTDILKKVHHILPRRPMLGKTDILPKDSPRQVEPTGRVSSTIGEAGAGESPREPLSPPIPSPLTLPFRAQPAHSLSLHHSHRLSPPAQLTFSLFAIEQAVGWCRPVDLMVGRARVFDSPWQHGGGPQGSSVVGGTSSSCQGHHGRVGGQPTAPRAPFIAPACSSRSLPAPHCSPPASPTSPPSPTLVCGRYVAF